MVTILATTFAALAALLHVYIFVMESIQWTQPRIWRRFGVPNQAAADTTKPMAYNQGFYNLFLAIGATLGIVLFFAGAETPAVRAAGLALVLFSLGSMVAAALVLLTSDVKKYVRPALIQGTLPLVGFVLFLFA
jgi:putative membrane protein